MVFTTNEFISKVPIQFYNIMPSTAHFITHHGQFMSDLDKFQWVSSNLCEPDHAGTVNHAYFYSGT